MEHLYQNALDEFEGMLASLSGSSTSAKVMKRSKIKALIDSAGDADSITSTLGYLAELVSFSIISIII